MDSIEIVDAHTITTRSPGVRTTYVDGRESSSCRFVTAFRGVGTLVRTTHGKTTYSTVRVGAGEGNPCD